MSTDFVYPNLANLPGELIQATGPDSLSSIRKSIGQKYLLTVRPDNLDYSQESGREPRSPKSW